MTEQHSPWAQPDTQVVLAPVGPAPTIQRAAEPPRAAPGYRSGRVSGIGVPPIVPPPSTSPGGGGGDDDDPVRRSKRIMKVLSAGAVAVVAIGLVVILVSLMTGNATTPGGLFDDKVKGPSDTRPELARRCPPPTIPPEAPPGGAAVPAGPRISDPEAGISYKEYGDPWQPWDQAWVDRGDLKVTYRIGQHVVTEPNYNGNSDYHATILSGHVPATINDGSVLDLKCAGDQIAADVRISFYPDHNQLEQISAKDLTLGGRPARLLKFRLHFSQPGLKAKSELVSIALIDLGKPEAAILYVSIPDTHRQFDYIADEAPESVRPL
jgi:hypothetical protein